MSSSIFKTAFDVPAGIRNTDKAPLSIIQSFGRFEHYRAGSYVIGVRFVPFRKGSTAQELLTNDADQAVLIFTDVSNPSVPTTIAKMEEVKRNSPQEKILQMTFGTIDTPTTVFSDMIPLNNVNSHLVIRDGELRGILVDAVGYYSLDGGKPVVAPGEEDKAIPYYDTKKVRGENVTDDKTFGFGLEVGKTPFVAKNYGARRKGVKKVARKRVRKARKYC